MRAAPAGIFVILLAAEAPAAANLPCPNGRTIPAGQPCPPAPWQLHFDWNSTALTPEDAYMLDPAVEAYRHLEYRGIVITGHADGSGPAPYNLDLSRRRAEAVRAEFVRRGIPAGEIRIAAEGEAHPVGAPSDGVRGPRNRRVEIVLGSDGPHPSGW